MTDGPFFGPSRQPARGRPRRTRPSADVFPKPTDIADRAYELFLANGIRGECASDYWRRAEDELLDLAARRVLGF